MDNKQLLDEYTNVYMYGVKYVEDLVSEPTKKYGISFEQYLILKQLSEEENVSLIDIAKKRHVTRGAISRQIRVLLKKGYIAQLSNKKDMRRLDLVLTASGEKTLAKLSPEIVECFNGWIDIIGREKFESMLLLMEEFMQNIIIRRKENEQV